MAAYDAYPNLMLGLQQPHDGEERVVLTGQQARFDTRRGIDHMNVDAQAPRDIRTLQQAAVTVLEVHQFDRDAVAKISETIKNALAGNLPSENASVQDSQAVTEFCELLCSCVEQTIDELGAPKLDDTDSPVQIDPDNPIIHQIEALGINIEKIVRECIAVYMHFTRKEDQANFFYNLLLGKLVNNLQKSILTQEYRQSFVTLDDEATTCSREPLTKDQKKITKSFLGQIFDSLRITVWIKVADFLELGSNSDSKTSFKIKIGGPAMQSPTSAATGTIGMRPLEHTAEVCRLLLNSGRLRAEQMRVIESRLLHSTMLASTIDPPEGSVSSTEGSHPAGLKESFVPGQEQKSASTSSQHVQTGKVSDISSTVRHSLQQMQKTPEEESPEIPDLRSELRRQIRKDVEEEFECPVCLETYKELRIFPECQHFACTECVGGIRPSGKGKQGIDCPVCRTYIEVPLGGLPPHRMVKNVRERLRIQEQEPEQDEHLSAAPQVAAGKDSDAGSTVGHSSKRSHSEDTMPHRAQKPARQTEEPSGSSEEDLKQKQKVPEEGSPGTSGRDTKSFTEATAPSLHIEHTEEQSTRKTKYNLCWKTRPLAGDTAELNDSEWYRDMKSSTLTLDELLETVAEEEITHLAFHRDTPVPADLPEKIKQSLKHVVIKGDGGATQNIHILSCLQNMRNLESLCIVNVEIEMSDEVRDVMVSLELKHLSLSKCGLTTDSLASISRMTSLEELELSDNNLSSDVHHTEKLSDLTLLKKLDLSNCKLNQIPQSVSKMTSLEDLSMSGNDLSSDGSLNEKMAALTLLKKLDLSSCRLRDIPPSIYQMVSLEELDFKGNRLYSQTVSHASLHIQKSLKKLNISYCKLTVVPPSISGMLSLEELDLSWNNLGSDKSISKKLSSLTSMRRLDLQGCKLTEIPESISGMTSLEELDLSRNDLSSDKSISKESFSIPSMRRLHLRHCKLTEIPESVQSMSNIEVLEVSVNKIEIIPEWIGRLTSLKELLVSENKSLGKLDKNLLSLGKLQLLDTKGCDNLSKPPFAVCEAGLDSIRQYYNDLDDETAHSITPVTVVVLGQKMAGKTSLIKSLQRKEIVPDTGTEPSKEDQTARLFNPFPIRLNGPDPNQNVEVKFIDFEADEMYQQAYRSILTKDCIPVIVANITEFKRESQACGLRNAARHAVINFVAQLYLACPLLDKPILVLTHKDQHSEPHFKKLKNKLLTTVSALLKELIQEDNISSRIDALQSELFADDHIFEVCHDADYATVVGLEHVLYRRTTASEVIIPRSWKVIMDIIKSQEQSYVDKKELMSKELRDEPKLQYAIILEFMRRSGEILWYPDATDLGDIIFHDISRVTGMIIQLFNHAEAENKSMLTKEDLEELWQKTEYDSQLPADIAISLLTTFHLIYGPMELNVNRECYLIPHFMKSHRFTPSRADINLQGQLKFRGLPVPVCAYQQMTVSFLKLLQQSDFHVYAFGNGASGRFVTYIGAAGEDDQYVLESELINEPELQRVTVRIEGDVSQVHQCWKVFQNAIKDLTDTVMIRWPACLIRYAFTCPHCLLLEELSPETTDNPEFIRQAITGKQEIADYRADCRCRNMSDVPSPLKYPCGKLKELEMKSLVQYIRSLHPDAEREISDILAMASKVFNMDPYPQTALIRPSSVIEKVYQMTSTRGRALVINNRNGDIGVGGGGRRSSDIDYANVTNMLQKFGFIISEISGDGDWSSHEMVEAVHRETELLDRGASVHRSLGMFVLVMMSNGDTGTIIGCDDKHVNLVDIYNLLSSPNFPAMKGKPKLVILQASSGDRQVMMAARPVPTTSDWQRVPTQRQTVTLTAPEKATRPNIENYTDDSHQTMDDLLLMKASFDGHQSYRMFDTGSFFIRALVAVFYRYAGEKDLRTLSDMIQDVVRKEAGAHGREQIPVTISTFTNGRKLYLSPGVNMRTTNHPESFTTVELPPPDRQRILINWRDDEEAFGGNYGHVKKIVHFEVVRNI